MGADGFEAKQHPDFTNRSTEKQHIHWISCGFSQFSSVYGVKQFESDDATSIVIFISLPVNIAHDRISKLE